MSDEVQTYKVEVLRAEMPIEMQKHAISKVSSCLSEKMIEKDIAAALKQSFDKEFKPTWQAIVGKCFGSSITHETKYLFFVKVGPAYVLLFKSQD